jgi:hypothetical protein
MLTEERMEDVLIVSEFLRALEELEELCILDLALTEHEHAQLDRNTLVNLQIRGSSRSLQ